MTSAGARTWPATIVAVAAMVLMVLTSAMPGAVQGRQETPALSGVYAIRLEPRDLPASLADSAALTGLWTLTLGDDGVFSLARQDVGEVASGTFEAGEASLAFTTWQGLVGCAISGDGATPATYAWRGSEHGLTLTAIDDACPERLALLTTRALGAFAACAVAPRLMASQGGPASGSGSAQATPEPAREPAQGVAAQEGPSGASEIEAAIDHLLQQASGCWALGDVDRFMALHSRRLAGELALMGPVADFSRELHSFMATPVALTRIGPVTLTDADRAWAYVEIDLDGEATPQRVNFLQENGEWLFDSFFLFGPPLPGGAVGNEPGTREHGA